MRENPDINEESSLQAFIISMFVLGLGTSLHCVSMCGPLVLTYAVKGEEDGPWYRKITPNVAYQAAKIFSYMLVGLLLGALGAFLNLDAARPYVYYVAGVFMIVLGLGMTGKVPWAARLTPRPPKWLMNALVKLRRKSAEDAEHGVSYACHTDHLRSHDGAASLWAAHGRSGCGGGERQPGHGRARHGGIRSWHGAAHGGLRYRRQPHPARVEAAHDVGAGHRCHLVRFVFINRGLTATGAPVNFTTVKTALLGTPRASAVSYTTAADGVVEIPLTIENTQFVPQVVQIPADKPVRLVVDRREDGACSDQIYLPQLNILQDLAPNGVTMVDIPATKAGAYTLTCGMSMMSGQLIVGDTATGPQTPPVASARHLRSGRSALCRQSS